MKEVTAANVLAGSCLIAAPHFGIAENTKGWVGGQTVMGDWMVIGQDSSTRQD